jgi:hypothetical protein
MTSAFAALPCRHAIIFCQSLPCNQPALLQQPLFNEKLSPGDSIHQSIGTRYAFFKYDYCFE